jgi:hypothetical protein
LCEAGLYVTDRRVLVVASVFRLLTQEMSQWHAGCADGRTGEVIRRVEVGHHSLLGPYLEIVSTTAEQHWYRSPELRVRLYLKNAEDARRIIANALDKL